MSRSLALAQLAKAIHFRESSLRKLPAEKRADLLASRVGAADFEEIFEAALLGFHLQERVELMSACLDSWGIEHENGAIGEGDYTVPDDAKLRETLGPLEEQFNRADLILYLATAGLVMGETGSEWRGVTWPIVDEQVTVEG